MTTKREHMAMTGKEIVPLTMDEIEDIRFALGRLAELNEEKADNMDRIVGYGTAPAKALAEQAERFRALARKVSA
jgi:hypothetical protein